MLPARDEMQLLEAVERSRSMAARGFGTAEVYLERLVERPRHVEFQVLGDAHGEAAHLWERDCSTQRRNQKVIEEAPAPNIERAEISAVAERVAGIMRSMGYDNIGTVEMLMGADGAFNFLEMNTRLQVEHGVTEEVTGVDLVQRPDPLRRRRQAGGHTARDDRVDGPCDPGPRIRRRPEEFLPIAGSAQGVPPAAGPGDPR